MQPRRGTGDREGAARDQAARRLAQIAQGIGSPPPTAPVEEADPTEKQWWRDHTRVALDRTAAETHQALSPPGRPPETPGPAVLPRPGRHAARRSVARPLGGPALGRLPELRPGHVTIVALAVAIALAVTTWWVTRDRPEPTAGPAEIAAGSGGQLEPLAAEAQLAETAPDADATVTVDVAGKVRRPGIVVLDEGARVSDALDAAGGARRGVDLTGINLARVLVDGEQIVVGAVAPAGPAGLPVGPSGSPTGALVNLNLAGVAELEGLPEVGPVTAAAIVAWRDEHGGFTSVDELLEVDGIGAKTLETIAPHVTV